MEEMILELDDWFCRTYANVQRLSTLPGYRMPSAGEVAQKDYKAADRMKLYRQSNRGDLLALFKDSVTDMEVGFSYSVPHLSERIRDFFHPGISPQKNIKSLLKRTGNTKTPVWEKIGVDREVWRYIVKGALRPTRRSVMRLCIVTGAGVEDYDRLLDSISLERDDEDVWEIIGIFILSKHITDMQAVEACFAAYNLHFAKQND